MHDSSVAAFCRVRLTCALVMLAGVKQPATSCDSWPTYDKIHCVDWGQREILLASWILNSALVVLVVVDIPCIHLTAEHQYVLYTSSAGNPLPACTGKYAF